MRLITMTLALLTVGACGKSEEAVTPMAEEAAKEARTERRFAVDALRDEARDLGARPDEANRTLVKALNHTAEALRTFVGTNEIARARIDNIETYASQIEREQVASKEISGWAKSALIESALTLSAIAEEKGRDDLTPWVRAVHARAEAIDPAQRLEGQRDTLAAAFEDIADSITFLAKERPRDGEQTSRR
jgi:hypothetical protein